MTRRSLASILAACLALSSAWVPAAQAQSPATIPASQETALDRYVAAPDPHFAWRVRRTFRKAGLTVSAIDLTSQQWLTTKEVKRPLWTHRLTVLRPAKVGSDIGLLFITGGSNDKPPRLDFVPEMLGGMALDTGTVVAELRMVPNQPVVFTGDPTRKKRFEDDFIAYTWDHFLRTGEEAWLARLPMTKAAVRAMDTVTAFTSTDAGGGQPVRRFVVAGASKRGWTTWTTAAVDPRVVAIAPIVIDLLNLEASFRHHWQAYGAWAPAIQDYQDRKIMDWLGTPEFRALMRIEEPFEYRQRLTMPKLLLNAAGDEFFLPDSSQFYLDRLLGETHLRYVPNVGHDIGKSNAPETLHAFYASIVADRPRPSFDWRVEADGTLRIAAKDTPSAVRLWQATNPAARDFRIDTLGPKYTATNLRPSGPNTWTVRMNPPSAGWTAWFVELTFPTGGKYPLTFTTPVRVVPETLPFPPPAPATR